jgi:hypothetical protein
MELKINKADHMLVEQLLDTLPAPVRSYIHYLKVTIEQQQSQIQQLQTLVAQLQARLSKNSSNSSKPP